MGKTQRNNAKQRTGLVVVCVLDEVVLEHAHQDGGQEARQQQHRGLARVQA